LIADRLKKAAEVAKELEQAQLENKVMKRAKAEFELGSTNVYADLAYKAPDDMLVKARLVSKIAELLEERHFTQTKAAAVLDIPQPKLSKMLRGQFSGFSERRLMDCLTRLGQDVDIVVRKKASARGEGAVSVSFA